jgi:hypothetical protein
VTRILARSLATRLLLYDYNAVLVLDSTSDHEDYDFFPHHRRYHGSPFARVTHGPVLPLQLAAAVNQYDDTLYRFAHSLSQQFTRRYFHLHDLDFTEAAIRAVKGFPSELGSPNIIIVVRATPQGQELPEGFKPGENFSVIE